MTFIRTKSGIKNSCKFYNVDMLVYTEGKKSVKGNLIIYDEQFYSALLAGLFPSKKVKVKSVGNKADALNYAKYIEQSGALDSIVVVDRDMEDLTCSLLKTKGLIYTYGYSWENDFWTSELSSKILTDLSCSSESTDKLIGQLTKVKVPLSTLSAYDSLCHINSESLLPKNGGACGISFNFSSLEMLSVDEFSRLEDKYQRLDASACSVCCSYEERAKSFVPEKVIQGHLWEYVNMNAIREYLSTIANEVLKNLAMSVFKANPSAYLGLPSWAYYNNEFKKYFEIEGASLEWH